MFRNLGVKVLLALCSSYCFACQIAEVSSLSLPKTLSKTSHQSDYISLQQSRRTFAQEIGALSFVTGITWTGLIASPAVAGESLAELKATVQEARRQLDPVPDIIQKQEWDKVRAILITPPLSDFWTKSKRKTNILVDVADAVGDAGGDELSILEQREEVQSHLRYLDMAVYNNVFNPIGTEGETGATKELIRSYYEDPKNELKASTAALDKILAEMQ